MNIDDLTGISEDRRKKAVGCLDNLMTYEGRPVISGYNWFNRVPESGRVITFSHIHETDAYRNAMLGDLESKGYDREHVLSCIRKKSGTFLWDIRYRFREDNWEILQGLQIKDVRTGEYIELEKFNEDSLRAYDQFKKSQGYLIAEDKGWELDLPFKNKAELMLLIDLFLRKSGKYIYDDEGREISETAAQRESRAPWDDAYETPVLVVGETAVKYKEELPQFDSATKLCLIENNNEISFVIHNMLSRLKELPHYEILRELGFKEEACLGNKPFLKTIDQSR